jgi:HK97 family phage major capsid protein
MNFGAFTPTLKRIQSIVRVSSQLLIQSPYIAASAIRRDLVAAVGEALDIGIFSGVGGSEPVGLCFDDQISKSVTYGGAPALIDPVTHKQTLGNAKVTAPLSFVSSPDVEAKWRQTEGLTGSGKPLWSDDNTVIGVPAYSTTAIAGDVSIMGAFSDLLVVIFAGIDVLVDPFTRAKNGEVEISVTMFADAGPLRSASFDRSTDSAAQ